MPPTEPVQFLGSTSFISYAQEDESLCEELEKHLKTLQRQNAIASWHDRKIVAGMELKNEIHQHLNRAGIILLMVSPDFIASDYHWTVEVTRALERNASGKARVIPVLLRHTDWEMPPIDKFLPLPRNRQPVKNWSDRDEAFVEIVKEIREEVTRLTANPNYLAEERVTTQVDEKRENQATILINEADKLREQGRLEEAVAKYRESLQYNPENVIAHNGLGITFYKQGKLIEAISAYHQAIQLNPNEGACYSNLAVVLAAQGELDEAITNLHRAIQLSPNEAAGHNNLGTTLCDQGKLDEAIAAFRRAIQLGPNDADAYNTLGMTLNKQGKLDEAIVAFRRAIQLDPNLALAHDGLGSALSDQGKLDEAVVVYRQAIQLDPNDGFFHNNLGLTLYAQGKLDEAVAAYSQAIQLVPNNAIIYENLGLALKT